VLNGAVGDYVTIARKDRNSDNWYVGAVTDENGRGLEIKLDFLDPDRRYEAQFYHDGEGADYRTEGRRELIVEKRIVTAKDVMALKMGPGGGAAIRFVPVR
jgi:alpha-glucosidase